MLAHKVQKIWDNGILFIPVRDYGSKFYTDPYCLTSSKDYIPNLLLWQNMAVDLDLEKSQFDTIALLESYCHNTTIKGRK